MFRPLLALGALIAAGAASIAALAADAPAAGGVTAFKDARAEGYFTLDASYLSQKKPSFNPDYSADGFGLANVHVLVRKADHGAFNGQFGVGVYATDGTSDAPTPKILLFMPAEAPLAITYVK